MISTSSMMSLDVTLLESHRPALKGHCYRMLGSPFDADDAVQETMVRAWTHRDRFEGRSSVRTWLYRIATNVCLDALADRARRARPTEDGPAGTPADTLRTEPAAHWLEPIPDAEAIPDDASPLDRAMLRQSIRLAFVSALQRLPARQRAALLLAEVLGWSASEIGVALEMSVAAVNSALQRARATLASRQTSAEPVNLSAAQSTLVDRYVDAFLRYDVDELVALLRDDATLSMPPYTLWLRGPQTIRAWMLGPGSGCRGSRLLPVAASGLPAWGQYRPSPDGIFRPWALIVLELAGDRIAAINSFLDTDRLFPMFGLAPELKE